jgi:DNA-binding transcriptional LysR family regulator
VHRSVSRTADALDVVQPVVSQGLRRLRALFDDELYVRTGRGMAPTALALALHEPVAQMLAIARRAIFPAPTFDPAQSTREFRVIVTDFGAASLLPGVLRELLPRAPHVQLRLLPLARDVFERLESTDADLAIGILSGAPRTIRTASIFRDQYVCALRQGHPALTPALSLAAFRPARHVVVSSQLDGSDRNERGGFDDRGTTRAALIVPNYAALPLVLSQTDLLAIVPRSAAHVFFAGQPLVFVDVPFKTPAIDVVAAWHERSTADLGLQWLRRMIAGAIAASGSRSLRRGRRSVRANEWR